jgi:ribonucleoside-diphosphate reductase alpha chain
MNQLNYSNDSKFDELGLKRLKDSYMRPNEKSPQERFRYVADSFGSNKEHADRLYAYMSEHWLSASTPILSFGKSKRGLPISCFKSFLPDSSEGLVETQREVNYLSMYGGGVGIGFGIRSEDDKSVGVLPHLKTYEANKMAYNQGQTRRGSYAAFLDIDHPNIIQFIEMRKPTGDQNFRCLELHHGVNVSDEFMELLEKCMLDANADDAWELKDPDSNVVKATVSAKRLWELLITTRMQTGEPYIHFIDTSNRYLPDFQKNAGLKVRQSNICVEIILPTDKDRTAVCCLSSLNLDYYDEWKDNYQFYKDVAEMLDNVLTYFIVNGDKSKIGRAVYSAMRERAIGVGVLAFTSYLQSKSIPFESAMAKSVNMQIFKNIRFNLDKANYELGIERGVCPDAEGSGEIRRFSSMTAIAPNATSSLIMGNTSPSIEPFRANAYRQDTMSGSHTNKNKHLAKIIKAKVEEGFIKSEDEVWSNIVSNKGSIQHLPYFTELEKDVFKTAEEIDQRWLVELAADRQKYISQSQSLNLFFPADVSIRYLHHVHFQAWKKGVKTLYYCRSGKLYYGDKIGQQIERKRIEESFTTEEECLACQ